ncbi:MAG: hypothetical protein HY897_13240 [Deltaproteobacteria bacterium]|nr:hypothetical protein [Deltaproteobacteria bacterium]
MEEEVTPRLVFAEAGRLGWSSLPAGESRIHSWLSARLAAADGKGTAWLLFGTFHDSAGQVDAFRRLVGPGGAGPFTHVVLEQLRADGRWKGIDEDQSGDSRLLADFMRTGDRVTYAALASAHEPHDYTAWKYGYSSSILDIVTTARATDIPAFGCDVPDALMRRLGHDDESNRLRELHCLFSLRDAVPGTAGTKVAMLWGQTHVSSAGFRRFLPPADVVVSVYAFGARASAEAPDSLLREKLVLNDPVLVPLGDREAAILLPDRFLGGEIDRARTSTVRPRDGEVPSASVRASAASPGTLALGSASFSLGAEEIRKDMAPGAHTYCFATPDGLRIVGNAVVPPHGWTELTFDPAARRTRVVEVWPGRNAEAAGHRP